MARRSASHGSNELIPVVFSVLLLVRLNIRVLLLMRSFERFHVKEIKSLTCTLSILWCLLGIDRTSQRRLSLVRTLDER